jgi:hypothetical protein
MAERVPRTDVDRRFSVRASITVWLLAAAVIWVCVGALVTYVAEWGKRTLEIEAERLSGIAPAAGPQTTADRKQGNGRSP